MKTEPLIIFSTRTGNAFKMAEAAGEYMPCAYTGPYNIFYVDDAMLAEHELLVICYWCDHGSADEATAKLLCELREKKLVLLGTMGARPDTAHGEKVKANVEKRISPGNQLLSHYLCRGSIDLKRTIKRTRIPVGERGHLSLERFEKQKESLGHPDAAELKMAGESVREAVLTLI